MAESSILWTTDGTGDGTGSGYTMAQVIEWMRLFVGVNSTNLSGVAPDYLNELAVTGTATPVSVNTGGALVYGFPYFNSAAVTVAVSTPAADTRVDYIVLEADWAAQTVRIASVAGTEGAGVPALTQTPSTTWQMPLAQASITTGGVITVTDAREWINAVGDGDVVTAKLADDAVTAAKLAASAVDPRASIDGQNGIVIDPNNGDARGTDATDLQTLRSASTMVASGNNSTIAGGEDNTASAAHSTVSGGEDNTASAAHSTVVGGDTNTASAVYATAMGFNAGATHYNELAHGTYKTGSQVRQSSVYVVTGTTTDATAGVELFLDGEGGSQRITLPTESAMVFQALIMGISTGQQHAAYKIEGMIANLSGTTAYAGGAAQDKVIIVEQDSAWDANVVADDTNDAVQVEVQGNTGDTVYWVARVVTAQIFTAY